MNLENAIRKFPVGAHFQPKLGTHFRVWAPKATSICVKIGETLRPLVAKEHGYFEGAFSDVVAGVKYRYVVDDKIELADPASRFQPEGVHGASEVVSSEFIWTDSGWRGVDRDTLTLYELHVGTFTREGTFEAIIPHLSYLSELGINAIELMPISQFPGKRNWGYDGVFAFAAQNSYGGPLGLKKLIDACHERHIAVILDVVYNHIGPEGNVLPSYGEYFQNRYKTPWGEAINYDGAGSDEVKKYFLQNALQWLEEFHFDGLRLDAVHAICDESQHRFLEHLTELKESAEKHTNRKLHLIAESDLNDPRLLDPRAENGFGIDLQWNDDFHHAIHSALTGEVNGYYADFGHPVQIAKAFEHGVVYADSYSEFRKCSRGKSFAKIQKNRLVVYNQNHDQIGNRVNGERLNQIADDRKQCLAACLMFLSPFTPQLFMGEEYGETRPFLYFIDHEDSKLVEAVVKGRKEEFKHFHGEPPNPALPQTFERCVLEFAKANSPEGKKHLALYRRLIELSKWIRSENIFDGDTLNGSYDADQKLLIIEAKGTLALFSLNEQPISFSLEPHSDYELLFDSNHVNVRTPVNEALELEPFAAYFLKGKMA